MRSEEKRLLEDFRVRQHAGPYPAKAAAPAGPAAAAAAAPSGASRAAPGAASAAAAGSEQIEPDTRRVILHFDADSFYAQVEEVRDASLRGRPVGVTQKYLIVTCNYAAREHGVTKLMGVAEAKKRCPHIVLVSGEDLTPYRKASKQIMAVLQRYGTAEKLGLDEMFVDATAEAKRRLEALGPTAPLPPWHGHVHSVGAQQLQQDSRHRPMDLRVVPDGSATAVAAAAAAAAGGVAMAGAGGAAGHVAAGQIRAQGESCDGGSNGSGGRSWETLLRIGSAIAAEARAAVRDEAGYRTSAGVACNKMLAKLSSGLHKPDDQTVLLPPEAASFVAPLPVRALPGVGYKTEKDLAGMGVSTAAHLRALPRRELLQRFGERVGAFLFAACRGQDPSPVQERGPAKSVTVEDSFRSCPGFQAAEKVVRVLVPDLLARLQEELQEEGRRPATFTLKWRHHGSGWQRSSASCPMPQAVLSARVPPEQQMAALASAAMALLRRQLSEPFDLSLINIGATSFTEGSAAAAAAAQGTHSIADMFAASRGASQAAGRPASPLATDGSAAGAGAAAGASADGIRAAGAAAAGIRATELHRQPHQQQGPPVQQGQMTAAATAAASSLQRRSYSADPLQHAPLLSKRHERQLREQGSVQEERAMGGTAAGLPPGAAWTHGGGAGGFAAPNKASQLVAQRAQHAQHAQQPSGCGFGFAEEEAEEAEGEDGSRMWEDLQGLAAWRSRHSSGATGRDSGSRRRGPGAGGLTSGAAAGSGWQSQAGLPGAAAVNSRGGSAGGGAASGPGLASAAAPGSAAPAAGNVAGWCSSGRVVIHADVDCFYCQVERMDDPSLLGVPLVVQQFNAGGFVAVSYEARAAGIRCGDGAGAAGRAAVPHLVHMQAASLEECRRRCPGLQVRPMRTDRYRQVSQQMHKLLRSFSPDGQVERTSYDDCYLDISAACTNGVSAACTGGTSAACNGTSSLGPAALGSYAQALTPLHGKLEGAPAGLLIVTGGGTQGSGRQAEQQQQQQGQQGQQQQQGQKGQQQQHHHHHHHHHQHAEGERWRQQQHAERWRQLPPDLRHGVLHALALRRAAKEQLGLTISCGVARSKLVARLASPLGKPDGLVVVPDSAAAAFLCSLPLQKVPSLRGKFGGEVSSQLGVTFVRELAAFSRADLVRRFGEQRGMFLAALPLAQDDTPVRERGPQKTIVSERSFPPLPSEAAAASELAPLACALLARAAQDALENSRLPSKLVVSYRQGYGSNPRSKSAPVPREVLRWLQADAVAGAANSRQGAAAATTTVAAATTGAALPEPRGNSTVAPLPDDEQQQQQQQQQQHNQPQQLHQQQRQLRQDEASLASAVVSAALALLRPAVAASGWQLTRLAVSFAFDGGNSNGNSSQQAGVPGQLGIAAFMASTAAGGAGSTALQPQGAGTAAAGAAHARAAGGGPLEAASGCCENQPLAGPGREERPRQQHEHQQMVQMKQQRHHQQQQQQQRRQQPTSQEGPQQQQRQQQQPTSEEGPQQHQQQRHQQQPTSQEEPHQPQQQPPATASCSSHMAQEPQHARPPPARASCPASYRNPEALALQQLFANSRSLAERLPLGADPSGPGPQAAMLAGADLADADLSPAERASLELALKLQAEEAHGAAAAASAAAAAGAAAPSAGKRGAQAKAGGSSTGGARAKVPRRGSGPLDAFFKKRA